MNTVLAANVAQEDPMDVDLGGEERGAGKARHRAAPDYTCAPHDAMASRIGTQQVGAAGISGHGVLLVWHPAVMASAHLTPAPARSIVVWLGCTHVLHLGSSSCSNSRVCIPLSCSMS